MSERRRVVVIGGGVAGLAAAFGYADRGDEVVLLEARSRCGGRAFASADRVLGRRLDNGAHVMLGCYRATRALLRRLGTEGKFAQAQRLELVYRFATGRTTRLALSRLPVPLAMPWAVLRLGIGFGARLRAVFGMASVLLGAGRDRSFADWLRQRWQRGAPDDVLWRPLCRAVMNVEPDQAEARLFLATLREAFLGRAANAAIWVPAASWGELIGDPAPAALAAAGVALRTGARVVGLERDTDRVRAIALAGGERIELADGDLVVSAVPWFALAKLLPDLAGPTFARLRSSPIVTAYCELPDDAAAPPDEGPVVALVAGSPFHFLLRTVGEPRRRFALLSGGDRWFDGRKVDEIAATARAQLQRYFPGVDAGAAVVRVRKEQHATFVPEVGQERLRPRPGRLAGGPHNLLCCGDWTATGFPATLEGAARSAERVVALGGPA